MRTEHPVPDSLDEPMAPSDAWTVVRSRDRCEAVGLLPGPCAGRPEVHELARGVYRKHCLPYPELRVLLCSWHHQVVTSNPDKAFQVGLAWGPMSEARLKALGLLKTVNER